MLTFEIACNRAQQILLNDKISHALYVIFNAKAGKLQNQGHLACFEIVV